MFEPDITREDQLKAAYRLRNKEIAFSPYAKETAEKYALYRQSDNTLMARIFTIKHKAI